MKRWERNRLEEKEHREVKYNKIGRMIVYSYCLRSGNRNGLGSASGHYR
jgi:hypothetical protein